MAGKERKTTENSRRGRKTAGDGMGGLETVGDGGGRWGTVLHSDVWGKFQKSLDGMTESHPSLSLILTCRATLENDRTGRQTTFHPRPSSGRTDCLVANTTNG